MDVSENISPSLEDYLETIYFLNNRSDSVRSTDVAIEMSISKPSVNKAINNLKRQGYVLHEHYGTINLTPKGLEAAKAVAARHMTLTKFLHEIIGVDKVTAEIDACKIEHVISADTHEKISAYLDKVLNV